MTYPQTIRYLESFVNHENKSDYPYRESLKLERIRDFLRVIGDPQDRLKCIHVAGTKGKGSTCAFAANILRSAGYKTGLYTSPHLSDFRERIRILTPAPRSPGRQRDDFEGMISKKALALLAQRLRPEIDRYNRNSKYGPLTFFEVYTALAFVYFVRERVDFAVLETGLGGRLDATNVVHPLAAAITPISLEHTGILGRTLKKIAREKAGIIKRRPSSVVRRPLIVISAPQKEEAAQVIRKRCRDQGVELREVGKDIKFKVKGKEFDIAGVNAAYRSLRTRLLGGHQLINAATAIGIIEVLRESGAKITNAALIRGLLGTRWPGRCEIMRQHPWVILDGAQNAASAETIKITVRRNFPHKKLFLILGISSDKDISGICRQVCPMADKIILTRSANPRAARLVDMERVIRGLFKKPGKDVITTENTKEAIGIARALSGSKDLILVTGSLFVVGELRYELMANR